MNTQASLIDFIAQCPTAFHTARSVRRRLEACGWKSFDFHNGALEPGGKYFFEKASSIFAFSIPQEAPAGFMIVAVHGDSPSFKLKHSRMLSRGGAVCLNTERYGGMNLHSWFDIPLGVAGRLVTEDHGVIRSVLTDSGRDICLIPGVASHLMRDPGQPDPKNDLFPLYSMEAKGEDVLNFLCEKSGVNPDTVTGADLFLYNRMNGTLWGEKEEFVSAPRLDDLQCVYAALEAFVDAQDSRAIPVLCVFDNEEVGSGTKQGADSATFANLLNGILDRLGTDAIEKEKIFAASFALSADNAHGVHPNHPELNDSMDRPVLNGGVVVKFNANQRYTTDGVSCAVLKNFGKRAEIPLQFYSNRSDLPGGSTLGNLLVRYLPVDCVDIGLPQLSMHSSFETAGNRDTHSMIRLMQCFFSSWIVRSGDGLEIRNKCERK